ncbi:ABC transporter substrate-binding protein [Ketogulonicigenium vulgare]|uniref:ABC transporter substrate-binding protein n=1 Tax=Ketogulonicigenium vulgare (strain WSH-001) TaxID=759362 RepID=F9Y759_KETVW|nr:extracellular solute-binding protein [Ketogulonicigenium vulgare]ADO41253.1 ABC transporter substrate-binding protein [Ketogulonicigenium vulgare Y25]AEM42249.1 ABC transporter substrate-binding protein [Ketogulonicigenium vulgare WSH-001]ALJ79867.1 ABC transporter substrate-binding protein [Ketogulonicigenium vulgare]ANW32772.1 ABC transporter substrate-binding protein [Ketogulonicigenium vulgare]AOZ53082.1 ABC transporter substrate-binding protein [Ketogulonicigenium vulgare]
MSIMKRRTFGKLVLGAGVAAPFHFVRSAVAQPQPGDELIVGIWGGAQERIVREFVEPALVDKYGCKVSYVLGGTGERRARAYAERGRPSFDVIYLNIYESRQAVTDGVTQAPTDAVANAEYLYPLAKQGGYGVAFNPCTIVYKTDKASSPITSYADLFKDEWKGRFASPTVPGMQGIAALLMLAKTYGGDEFNIDVGFQKLQELKPFAAIQNSAEAAWQMFEQDIADITIEFGSLANMAKDSVLPGITIADPVEGICAAMNVACITTGTQNQVLAEEWINLHLSEPCMQAYMRQTYYSPTVSNVAIPADIADKILTPDQVSRLASFDWEHIASAQAEWSSRFTREIAG